MICLFPSLPSQLKAWFWGHRGWGGWMKHSVFQRETTISLASRLREKKAQFLLLVCKAAKGTQYMDSHLLLCKAWLMRFIFHNPFLSHCLIDSKLQRHQRRHPNLSYKENLINPNVKDDVDNVSNHKCSACYKTRDLFFPTCHLYNKAIIVLSKKYGAEHHRWAQRFSFILEHVVAQ